jgi:hypothetical protein
VRMRAPVEHQHSMGFGQLVPYDTRAFHISTMR